MRGKTVTLLDLAALLTLALASLKAAGISLPWLVVVAPALAYLLLAALTLLLLTCLVSSKPFPFV
jgi:hypothetical protein